MLTMTKVFGKETLNEGDKGKNLLPKVAKLWASTYQALILFILAIIVRIVFFGDFFLSDILGDDDDGDDDDGEVVVMMVLS